MKKIVFNPLYILLVFMTALSWAQQDPQYTHYMYNPQAINPAFSGYRGTLNAVLIHRSQWVGVDGAPTTQSFSIHSPLDNENVALGLNLNNDKLGATNNMAANADFSYTISTSRFDNFAFGIKAGVERFNVDVNKLTLENKNDPKLANLTNKMLPQVGVGALYYNDKYYLGLSVPNLLETAYSKDYKNNDVYVAKEKMHFYAMGGYIFDLSDNTIVKTTLLSKVVPGAPVQVDASANFLLREKLTLGVAYRWDAAVSGLVAYQVSKSILLGVAYDYELTDFSKLSSGSFEFVMRYELFKSNSSKKILDPRVF